MRASVFVSASAFAVAALAQESSGAAPTSVDAFPQTTFLQQTNSNGVVTGQPGVVTSIPEQPAGDTELPAAATSVGVPASIPALDSGIHTVQVPGTAGPNSTATAVVSVGGNSTSMVNSPTQSASGTNASGTDADSTASSTGDETDSTASPTGDDAEGAAPTMAAMAGSVLGLGAFVAAFL